MSREITVTVSGPVGCGKSGIAGEIEIALTAIGVPVRWANASEENDAKSMCHGDFIGDIEMYKPTVVIVEESGATDSYVDFNLLRDAISWFDSHEVEQKLSHLPWWVKMARERIVSILTAPPAPAKRIDDGTEDR
jgi:hypothetical protein